MLTAVPFLLLKSSWRRIAREPKRRVYGALPACIRRFAGVYAARKHQVILIIAVAILSAPTTAYASCSGFIDCLFGMTERTEVRAQRDIEKARISADAQAEIARIQGEAQARITQAEAEVERVRQLQYQSGADRDIAIAQANAKAEEYKAMIAGLTNEKIAGIQSNADTQIAALQEQSKIAIEGIVQTGQTERYRVAFGWATVIVGLVIMGAAILYWMRRQMHDAIMVLPGPVRNAAQLPWYSDSLEIAEVKHAITRKS